MTSTDVLLVLRGVERHLWWGMLARAVVIGLFGGGVLAAVLTPDAELRSAWLWSSTMTAALLWGVLAAASVRQVRAANTASMMIAAGETDQAERQLMEAVRSFSLYGAAKLLAVHNLAVVSHGRGQFDVAAELCAGVLRFARRARRAAYTVTRLLLADCRLNLNDLPAADRALDGLDLFDSRLSLSERLMLLPIRLRLDLVSGRHTEAADRLWHKVKLAETLEAPRAALVHAMLAIACRGVGRTTEADYLDRRADLYHDRTEVAAQLSGTLDAPTSATG